MNLLLLCLALGVGELGAQQMARPQAGFKSQVADSPGVDMRSGFIESMTYWKRGVLIGAIIGAGAWIALNVADGCRGECLGRAIGVSPFFGLLGAIPGALIGGLFPKRE